MKDLFPIIASIFLLTNSLFAQDERKIDSLQYEIKKFELHKMELGGNKITLMDSTKANILYLICEEYWMNSPEKGMDYSRQLLKLSEQIGFINGVANACNSMGIIYFYKGEYPKAIEYHKKALKISEEDIYKQGIAFSFLCIGNVLLSQGNYPEALKNYFASLKINEEIGDIKHISFCYNNIGNIYYQQHNYPEALKNYSGALKINEEIGYKLGIATGYGNLGIVNLEQGKYSEALKNFLASLAISDTMGNKDLIATAHCNIGFAFHQLGNYQEALKSQFTSLKIFEEIGDKDGLSFCYIKIGNTYFKQNKNYDAALYLNKGLLVAKEIGNLTYIKDGYFSFATLDSAQGNHKLALEHYKMFITARDSLFNEETTKKLVQSQMQYEFEKREAQTNTDHEKIQAASLAEINKQTLIRNAMLCGVGLTGIFSFLLVRSSNRKKKSTFEKQVAQVETKALRSQMNPHFIYNSLNSIDDYIRTNDIKNSSLYINKFSRLMRLILESSRKDEVSLKEDLESLDLYMQLENLRMPKKVECIVNVSPEIDTENLLIPPLLLQPFIENSFKHAFHGIEAPKLEINLIIKDNMLVCTVIDNGIGRHNKQTVLSEIHENRPSLGMTVTRERLDIISKIRNCRAYFVFEDLVDNSQKAMGTKVLLSVPATYAF